jgi:tRNA modification GTPase
MLFPDTIFALSSGKPPAGVAVVRISGPHARQVLTTLSGRELPPRLLTNAAIRARDGRVLDRGMMVFFPGPRSFTGEDCAELHLHGGRAVVGAVLDELAGIQGLRPAEAGEFSRRAFHNGKMDLVEAEALGDLIAAETEAQRRFAVAAAGGALSDLYERWRRRMLDARARIEAELDFSDDADVPESVPDEVWADLERLRAEIALHMEGYRRGEIIREGYSVVILGRPNAGKSSLLNALARRDVAIVTDEPGTTRDLVQVALDLDGSKIILTDTAGVRESANRVERIGIERALESARNADLVILLHDLSDPEPPGDLPVDCRNVLRVGSKRDLTEGGQVPEQGYDLLVSARTGEGLDELMGAISASAASQMGDAGSLLPMRPRHLVHLRAACECLALAMEGELELRAEALRQASDALGRIAGRIDVEEVLGAIFSRFCIGK